MERSKENKGKRFDSLFIDEESELMNESRMIREKGKLLVQRPM